MIDIYKISFWLYWFPISLCWPMYLARIFWPSSNAWSRPNVVRTPALTPPWKININITSCFLSFILCQIMKPGEYSAWSIQLLQPEHLGKRNMLTGNDTFLYRCSMTESGRGEPSAVWIFILMSVLLCFFSHTSFSNRAWNRLKFHTLLVNYARSCSFQTHSQ